MRQQRSVATLTIIILVAVTTLLIGGVGAISFLSETQNQNAQLQTKAKLMADQLAAALALPMWNFDKPQIDRVTDGILQDREVDVVVVRQIDVSAPGGFSIQNKHRDPSGQITLAGTDIVSTGPLVQEVSVQSDGETLGWVKLIITPKFIEAAMRRRLLGVIALIIGVDLILITSLYLLLRQFVLKPLRMLEQYAGAVSSNDGNQPSAGSGKLYGELLSLRGSIERMVALLHTRYEALQFNEEQFRLLFEQNIVGIIICEVNRDELKQPCDFKLVRANSAFERLTGHKRAEQIGKSSDQLDWRWPAELQARLCNLAFSGEGFSYERYNDSLARFFEVRAFSPMKGQFAMIFNDISERKRAEAVLLESEKMRMVAGLAAGMAHEINNPLAGVMQNTQLVIQRLAPGLAPNQAAAVEAGTTIEVVLDYINRRNIPEMLAAIRASGERAAAIVSNMLSFSRNSEADMKLHSIAVILDQTLELARGDYDLKKQYDFRNIQVTRDYDPNLPEILCHASEIQQVVLNLLTNAAQAMCQTTAPHIMLRALCDGDNARIEIEDNGPGMPEPVRQRVFEPFFTTKGPQAGSGLGLFVSYYIITRNHGGSIAVESGQGTGAKFIIKLPLARTPQIPPHSEE